MDKALKQRLVGASVLIILAVIVLPMLLSGRSETLNTESRQIELPPKPEELSFKTRRFPVGIPDKSAMSVAPKADRQDSEKTDTSDTLPLQQQSTSVDTTVTGNSTEDSTVASLAPEKEQPAVVEPETDSKAETPAPAVMNPVEAPPASTSVILKPSETSTDVEPANMPVLKGEPRYLVQVASFSSEKRANAMAAALRKQNMPVVMDVVDRTAGRLHRVRVGPYVERADADAVVTRVHSLDNDLSPRILDTRPDDSAPVSAPSDPLVRWVVQVGSYNNAGTAESEVSRLRLLGLTAFSEKVTSAKGTAYKVRIGPEVNRENAVQLAKDIKARHHIDGFVTTQE